MKLALVTDAWHPQVNGVVTTLVELVGQLQAMGHTVQVIQPGQFRTRPCPGYPGIDLALFPGARLGRMIDGAMPDARRMFEHGQCATPVPVRAKSAMPSASSFTQCACQTSRPTQPRDSAYSAGVMPNFSRL